MARHTPSSEELTHITVDRRPIVFLDIDGVLNNTDAWGTLRTMTGLPRYCKIDPENVVRLSRLIEATNPVVVLMTVIHFSSTATTCCMGAVIVLYLLFQEKLLLMYGRCCPLSPHHYTVDNSNSNKVRGVFFNFFFF